MINSEFRPHPEEFNLGYKPTRRTKEEKKERKWRLAHKLKVLMTSTLLIMPLTIHIGLWDIHSFKFGPGTYQCDSSIVHFDENTGWFYDGTFFIPLTWNQEEMTYNASGVYSDNIHSSAHETEFYHVVAGGDIEVTRDGFILLDPVTQQKRMYTTAEKTDTPIRSDAIDNYIANGIDLNGTWYGQISPGYSHISAYPTQLIISGNTATLLVSDTYSHQLASYPLTLSRNGCIIDFYISEPLTYSIETPEKILNFEYNDIMEGIIVFTEDGTFIELNVFTSQIFER